MDSWNPLFVFGRKNRKNRKGMTGKACFTSWICQQKRSAVLFPYPPALWLWHKSFPSLFPPTPWRFVPSKLLGRAFRFHQIHGTIFKSEKIGKNPNNEQVETLVHSYTNICAKKLRQLYSVPSWWFQPLWKILLYSKWEGIFPNRGEN